MATEPTATIRLVWPFVSLYRAHTQAHSTTWAENRMDDRIDDADARIPHSMVNRLLGAGWEQQGLTNLGLRAAERITPGDFDLIELVVRSRTTLGEAFECIARLLPLLHDAAVLTVVPMGSVTEATFGFKDGLKLHPNGYDFMLAAIMVSARRSLERPDLKAAEVLFPFPAPEDLSVYERIFRCPVHFDQPKAALRFHNDDMQLRMKHASPTVSAALERVAAELLAAGHSEGDFVPRVVSVIGEQLPAGDDCTADSVAKRLGVSRRSLQRRLSEEGTSFRAVLDDHRARLARAYLQRPDLSLAEIAYLLGFASAQAFHKAFKRWNEQTPAEFRASQRSA